LFRGAQTPHSLGGFDRRGLEDDLGELNHLVLAGPLELRAELVEPLVGLGVLRLGPPEMGADEVEVLLEAGEVLVELGHVGHHLMGVLLDPHASEAEHDHLEMRGEGRR
jgi:hypothetical protein